MNAKYSSSAALQAAQELRNVLQGRALVLNEAGYDESRLMWNGAVDRKPAVIVECETPQDIQSAVLAAQKRGLPLSVRGGGHDWVGRAHVEGGLTIDLSRMRNVSIDLQTKTATVSGGARASDVIAAGAPHGLVAVTGNVGAVGMAGLTLGGGYGPLMPRFGLALDNLLGAQVVLADGRLVSTNMEQSPDLFWALRGGGGNFGVVASMEMRLHEVPQVLGGFIIFSWSEAKTALERYATLAASAPDELGITVGIFSGPDGNPVVIVAPVWSGASSQGEGAMDGLRALGTPLMAPISPMPCGDLLRQFDASVVDGRHYEIKTRWISSLSLDVISAMLDSGSQRTSPHSVIALHHFRGQGTRIPVRSTAFGLRDEHFLVEIIAAWDPNDGHESSHHRKWAHDLWLKLGPLALPGGYPNFLSPDEHEQIRSAYGPNATRLAELKNRFDPNGLFLSAIPLSV